MKLEHPIIPLTGRLMITYIFATSGIAKVFSWSDNVQYMSTRHLPMIPVLLAIAAFIELAGSVCLITGYQIRIAAFVMFLYTTVVTVLFEFLLGLGIALVVNSNFKGRGFMRAAMLVPWAIITVVSAQMWKLMYNDIFGEIWPSWAAC